MRFQASLTSPASLCDTASSSRAATSPSSSSSISREANLTCNSDDHAQSHHQPTNPAIPSYQYPPPPHSASSSSSYPRLPLPNFTQSSHHSTAAQSRPQQHSTPSASLHAALREGADFLPRPSIVPRLPQLSRPNSASTQSSSFGYIPNHFFYSPPQSPQESDPPRHTANSNLTHQLATSSSVQSVAGPSFTNNSVGPSIRNPLSHQQAIGHSIPIERTASAFRSGQSQSQSHYQNTADQQHVKEEASTTMPVPTSTATTSRKRARPSEPGSPPSATKRHDTDEDEIEELEREALVTKQREESNKISRIGDLNCMICLEHFTNMTATHCARKKK
ncbi:unnamed protein product [Aureobasidium mustum]|uniref:Uncharacterized protein n=1 Tax=Aureobasidium mustum TaxID=2773714 RepID=A0A9N8JJI1_9PEZI|nr:unnamed protein product [Aureobasidium mustum]